MPNELSNLTVDEVSLVDRPANSETDPLTGRKIARARIALFKRDADVAKGVRYLVSGKDGDHLPVSGPDGKPDHKLMGAAWAALHSNHRGQPYAGPDKAGAIARLNRLYAQEGMDTPASKGDSMTLQEIEEKVTKLEPEVTALKAENAVLKAELEAVSKMTKKERKAFNNMTADKRKAYMAADADKRKAMMDDECKAMKAKSGDGPDPDDDDDDDSDGKPTGKARKALRVITKGMADVTKLATTQTERIAKLEAENTEVKKAARVEKFARIAKDKLPNTSGTDVEKAQFLIDLADVCKGEDTELFKKRLAELETADRQLGKSFIEIGKSGGGESAAGEMEMELTRISKRDNCTREQAMIALYGEKPEVIENWQAAVQKSYGRGGR